MARQIHSRFKITGTLDAKSPIHVGGSGGNADVDLALALNGQGNYYVPGTSLAGALRAWMAVLDEGAVDDLWGFQLTDGDRNEGHASFVLVEDAPIHLPHNAVMEIREGVGINRIWGTAAEQQKYNRAILPKGTKIQLNVTLERGVNFAEEKWSRYQFLFAQLLEALQQSEIYLGAAKTRGLGRVKLENLKIYEQQLLKREGILAALLDGGSLISLDEWRSPNNATSLSSKLTIDIHWKPSSPVMVKAEGEGIAVDILPLVSGVHGDVTFVLPGSSIKGSLRSQAERIIRTVRSLETPEAFLKQVQVPLVEVLFGSAAKSKTDKNNPEDKPLGLGALFVDDCYANIPIKPNKWAAVEAATNSHELRQALDDTNLQNTQQAFHVAIDRWTGGAADGFLYSVLEPMGVTWQPIHLTLNLDRLAKKKFEAALDYLPNITLFLLVLRDLMQSRIPIGFGTNRGMGAIEVEKIVIKGQGHLEELSFLEDITVTNSDFSEFDESHLETLNQAWQTWIEQPEGNND